MAGFKRVFRTNKSIKAAAQRAKLLAAQGSPYALKLQMMGLTKNGGAPLRFNKLMRKLGRQMKGNKEKLYPLADDGPAGFG